MHAKRADSCSAVIKPPVAKLSDAIGRTEAYVVAVLLFTVGYIQQAASNNVKTFASAQIFYSAGSTGVQVLQQIFVADTSNLLNRALFSTLPDIPFLWSPFAGPEIAGYFNLDHWRWGYGLWAIVLPVCFLPLLITLVWNQIKATRMGVAPTLPYSGIPFLKAAKKLALDVDLFGLLLLATAISLILLPLSLAPLAKGTWSNASMIAMLVIGGVCLPLFVLWERTPKLAPYAFFPKDLMKQRTVLAGCGIAFFYFMAYYLSNFPYYNPYLQIVEGYSTIAAGHIISTFSFTSTVSSIVVSLLIKYTAHYKYFITFGGCIYLLGIGLMVRYRTEGASVATLVGCQIALGIGGGLLNVPAQLGVQASASHGQVAAATAVFLTILEIGGACGNAVSGAVWSSLIPRKLEQYLPADLQDQASTIFASYTSAADRVTYPDGSPGRIAINRAYQETMTTILTIGLCISAPIIPLSLLMKNYKLDQLDQKVKGRVIGGVENTSDRSEGLGASDPVAATGEDNREVLRKRRGWPMSVFQRRGQA